MEEDWRLRRTEGSLRPIGAYPPACKPYWLEAAPVGEQRARRAEIEKVRRLERVNVKKMMKGKKMKVPLLDLSAQLKTIEGDLKAAVNKIIDSTKYIMGPQVVELEERINEYEQLIAMLNSMERSSEKFCF